MEFQISIKEGWKSLRFQVQHINITPISEQFKIIARNKTIVLESNRPLFRNKRLMHRAPDFKLVDGTLIYQNGIEVLAEAILKVLEPDGKKQG